MSSKDFKLKIFNKSKRLIAKTKTLSYLASKKRRNILEILNNIQFKKIKSIRGPKVIQWLTRFQKKKSPSI